MADTIRAVTDPEDDPKTGKSRATSGVKFPYYDLESCTGVASMIHEKAGGACDLAQLAALLNYSGVTNGGFRSRVAATKMFGLIENADDQRLKVSDRGRAIVAPVSEPKRTRAKADAFLAVELFKKVYDQYNGTTLPQEAGLKNLLRDDFQVVVARITPTIRIMLDSAEQAGFFKATGNRSRMVMPLAGSNGGVGTGSAPPKVTEPEKSATQQRGNGGGGDDGSGVDPAILGLLKRLPPGGTPITAKNRKALIDAFTAVVTFIYPDVEEQSERPQTEPVEAEV